VVGYLSSRIKHSPLQDRVKSRYDRQDFRQTVVATTTSAYAAYHSNLVLVHSMVFFVNFNKYSHLERVTLVVATTSSDSSE